MSHDLALRAARLSTETIKTKSSKNLSIAFEHHPKDPAERKHGVLFAVIGVGGDTKKAGDLIDLILETFHGEYYQDLEKSPLASFEDALSQINEELADYTNNGNTYWMGKLNAILAVQSGNTLHLTQAGKAEAFLIRGGKEVQVSRDLAGEDINPLRTFINVATGEVSEADKVALVTPGVLAACSPKELSDYVSEYHPKVAVSNIAEVVDNLGNKEAQNSAVIIEYLSAEALANETLEEAPDEIWLESGSKTEMVMDQTKDIAKGISGVLGSTGKNAKNFLKDKVTPLLNQEKLAFETEEQAADFFSDEESEENEDDNNVLMETPLKEVAEDDNVLIETEERFSHTDEPEKISFESIQTEEMEPKEEEANKNIIRIRESEESPKRAKIEETKNAILNNIGSFYGSALKLNPIKRTRKINFKKFKKEYFAGAALIIVAIGAFFAWSVTTQRMTAKNRDNEKQTYERASKLNSDGELYKEQKNFSKSLASFSEALAALDQIKDGEYYGSEASGLAEKIKSQILSLTKSQAKDLKEYADFSKVMTDENETVAGIYVGDSNTYAFSTTGKVYKVDKETGKVSIVQSIGKIEGKVLSAAPLYRIRSVVVLTDTPDVYEFDLDNNTYGKRVASDGWEKGSELRSYGTNLYLLNEKEISKHIRTYSGYGKGLSYFPDQSPLKDPVSFAIDSDVYVLNRDGAINRYTGGIDQEFKLKNLFYSLSGSNQIFTDEDLNNLFVLNKEGKYIAVFDKEGNYKNRYMINADNPTALSYDGNNLLVIDGKTIKSIKL